MRKVKKCTKCNKVKKLSKFSKNSRNKTDGRQPKCKQCNRVYYLANQEKIKNRISSHYFRHHEESLERRRRLSKRPEAKKKKKIQDKAYYLRNREKLCKEACAYAELNRARLQEYWHSWYNDNIKVNEYKKRHLAKINGNNTLTFQEIEDLFKKHPFCEYCGDYKSKLTVSHIIPLSRAGQNCIQNITIACESCNSSKGSKLLSEWLLIRDSNESRLGQES